MPDLIVIDDSQYQGDIDFDALNAWALQNFGGLAIIHRAGYGLHEDPKWKRNIAESLRVGARWISAYWYVNADDDAAAQAHKFVDVLGGQRVSVTAADIEEGEGDQQPREHAFLEVMTTDPATDWTYSGAWFMKAHNLGDVEWVAQYSNAEPLGTHVLWQNSSSYQIPGIAGNVDGSIFHGSIDDLIALTTQGDDMPLTAAEKDEIVGRVQNGLLSALRAPEFNVAHIRENTDAILARVGQLPTSSAGGAVDTNQLAKALHDLLAADEIKKLQAELAALGK